MENKLQTLKALWLKSFYDWLTPHDEPIHIFITNKIANIDFLRQYENEAGFVTLNISPSSVINFKLTDEALSFNAVFKGIDQSLYIPLPAVIGINYPKEKNGLMKPFTLPTQGLFEFQNDKLNIDRLVVKQANENKSSGDNKIIDFASRVSKKKDGK